MRILSLQEQVKFLGRVRTGKNLMVLILIMILLHLFLSEAYHFQTNPIWVDCDYSSNYTIPSPFKTNLDVLLSNLTDSAPNSNNLFFNNTFGTASVAYGLAQCRPDTSAYDCGICLYRSAFSASSNCLLACSASVRFDNCILRYSDRHFFSQVSSVFYIMYNGENVSNPTAFRKPLRELMYGLSSKASKNESRFAADSFNDSVIGKIYGMAECTRDLTDSGCSTCLNQSLQILLELFNYTKGRRVFSMSCLVDFELYPILASPPPPPRPLTNNETTINQGSHDDTMKTVLTVVLSLIVAIGLVSVAYLCLKKRRTIRKLIFLQDLQDDEADFTSGESKWFELSTLRDATDNFSNQNKLGQGGFGLVYKGTLKDGQDIAVKRLSARSSQGLQELRNEVIFVAKLQHRNLVRLLGCCLDSNEKLLVYEYLPNRSLDKFLFDDNGSQQLDWSSRDKIIEGIARGLLYLHEDSRLRIIHRDLKASNILLDANMNPKISDFGLAKHFGLNETQANTNRIAGTHGYMAPEYLMHGEFSPKSDVFSYGVLVLEIVTGRKNRGVVRYQPASDLVNDVWKYWNEGKVLDLIDRRVGGGLPAEQVLRCIHIGLLCVQEDPTKRPSMASVVNMLSSFSTSLPMPSIPGFFSRSRCIMESDEHSGNADLRLVGKGHTSGSTMQHANPTSINEISMSDMEPR